MIFEYLAKHALLLVVFFAGMALLIVVYRLWAGRRREQRLEEDRSGLWRYHRDTQFRRKRAYARALQKKRSTKAAGDPEPQGGGDKSAKTAAVLSFRGDLRAKEHNNFARLVDEVIINKDRLSEVIVRITSPGGMVAQYGHAFTQMERLRDTGLALTVCVDVVAASGGYLMSLPANKIVAAPFAIVGSIGVVAFVPNFRRFLLNRDIEPRTFTAGRFKRTVTFTDDADPEEVARFQLQLEAIHSMFRQALAKYRAGVDSEQVSTGEHWTAAETIEKELHLVDELGSSAQYLLQQNRDIDLVFISQKRSFWEDGLWRLASAVADQLESRLFADPLSGFN